MLRKGMPHKIKWIPLVRTEKAERLNNPYCGLYSIYRFYADSKRNLEEGSKLEDIMIDSSQQICLVEINLIDYNDKLLTLEAIHNVKRIFRYFTLEGKQMIVRFVYDWEGKGLLSEPKDIEYILKHMDQLTAVLKEHTRNIYIIQGLFIGSWGEMHNSRYLSERSLTRLAKKLYECSGESTQIALRCPSYWRMIFKTYQPLTGETAFTKFMKARFSLFNDGMLASETDFGTYGTVYARESKSYSDKWTRQDELEFQNELCKYVSNGGEAINDCEYNDVGMALESLKKMRISYLHCKYDEQVLDKWKTSKSGSLSPLWQDKSAYEYIVAHLGYRFTIMDVKLTIDSKQCSDLLVKVKICNTGFAPCYHRFEVKFIIRDASYSQVYEYEVDTDTRFYMPNKVTEIMKTIPIQNLNKQKYILCFGIYDPRSLQFIQVSNTFSEADHEGYYNLGNIVINDR